jgi:hypothetical protein
LTARLVSLETSRELFEADLLKKSEQLPTDQEQYMLLEAVFSDVEKLQKNQEQNMTNKVNIEFTQKQLEKLLTDVEKLKDKVRAMERVTRKIVQYLEDMEKKTKQMSFTKNLKKEVETGKHGTQKYVLKQGPNKGKTV